MALGLDQDLQLEVPNYVEAVQERLEGFADDELEELTGAREPEVVAENETSALEDYGSAPEFSGLVGWLNSKPLTLDEPARQGRPDRLLDVLVHQLPAHAPVPQGVGRALPRERADDRRRPHARVRLRAGADERARATRRSSGSEYPIALDNDFGTWNAWHNQYWPAKYLIDRAGHVRYYHFGEGEYDETEARDPRAARRARLDGGGRPRPGLQTLPTRAPTASSRRRATSATSGSPATSGPRSRPIASGRYACRAEAARRTS